MLSSDDVALYLQAEPSFSALVIEPDDEIVQRIRRRLLHRHPRHYAGLPDSALLAEQGRQIVRNDRVLVGV